MGGRMDGWMDEWMDGWMLGDDDFTAKKKRKKLRGLALSLVLPSRMEIGSTPRDEDDEEEEEEEEVEEEKEEEVVEEEKEEEEREEKEEEEEEEEEEEDDDEDEDVFTVASAILEDVCLNGTMEVTVGMAERDGEG
ncbi:hypothetical protein HZH68_004851 [Vespula germanica]|uniref:Uncharacterized protein n=1 Tax=Vespula germanica TaxID=30212 RepID=A0A834KPX9_VESGE|nr:hypothetical protein HZH68_004851 [Vespula germanica]